MKAEKSRINKLVRKVRGDSKVIPISKNIEDGIMDEISSVVSRYVCDKIPSKNIKKLLQIYTTRNKVSESPVPKLACTTK